jgi:hypothetical protein
MVSEQRILFRFVLRHPLISVPQDSRLAHRYLAIEFWIPSDERTSGASSINREEAFEDMHPHMKYH